MNQISDIRIRARGGASAAPVFLLVLLFLLTAGAGRAEAGVSLERSWGPQNGKSGNMVIAVVPADDGAIYTATLLGKVVRIKDGKRRKVVDYGDWAFDLALGPDGTFYLLTLEGIVRYSADGKLLGRIGGEKKPKKQRVADATAIEVAPDGTLLVSLSDEGAINRYRPGGKFLGRWDVTTNAKRGYPGDLAVEADGSVLVVDGNANVIRRLDANGKVVGRFGKPGWRRGQIFSPAEVATDRQGRVFIADGELNRIQAFTSEGEFIEEWGRSGYGGRNFQWVGGLAASGPGRVIVTDAWGVREFALNESSAAAYAGIGAWTRNWNVSARPGKVAQVPIRVVNFGGIRAENVSLCYRKGILGRRLATAGPRCRKLGSVEPGTGRTFKVRLRIPKPKPSDFPAPMFDFDVVVKSANAGSALAPSNVWVKRSRRGTR